MERIFDGAMGPALRGGVVALGNFDGFHRGHQAVVGDALNRARAEGRPALVATFDPHPARHFRPAAAPFALTATDQKLDLFAAFGVDATVVMTFDTAFAALLRERMNADPVLDPDELFAHVYAEPTAQLRAQRAELREELAS